MKRKKQPSEASILMWYHLTALAPLGFVVDKEVQFYPKRRWKFDFVVVRGLVRNAPGWMRLAIEIEGGVWIQGRHTRGSGFLGDIEKYNHATLKGWHLLRFTPQQVLDGTARSMILRALDALVGAG